MIVKCWSPKVPWGMRMTVSCSCISRLASLYGLVTRISSTTPGRTSSVLASIELVLPVIPIAVRRGPGHRVRDQSHLADRVQYAVNLG